MQLTQVLAVDTPTPRNETFARDPVYATVAPAITVDGVTLIPIKIEESDSEGQLTERVIILEVGRPQQARRVSNYDCDDSMGATEVEEIQATVYDASLSESINNLDGIMQNLQP